MPMSACCTKGKFYANFALLYSKGSFYANDFGIKPLCVRMLGLKMNHNGEILCQRLNYRGFLNLNAGV